MPFPRVVCEKVEPFSKTMDGCPLPPPPRPSWPLFDRVTRSDNLLVEAEAGAHTFPTNFKSLLREEDEFPF